MSEAEVNGLLMSPVLRAVIARSSTKVIRLSVGLVDISVCGISLVLSDNFLQSRVMRNVLNIEM